jgi:oligopeptidase B
MLKAPSGAPKPAEKTYSDTHHNITRADPYAWLRDDNWQAVMKDPQALDGDIRAHLEAENAYTDKVMAPTADLQETLFAEMRGRIQEDEASVPMNEGALSWATRYVKGGEHPLICCGARDAESDAMRVIIDGNQEADGKDFFKIINHAPDPQGKVLAWGYDDKGSEYFTVRLRHIETGQDLADELRDTGGSFGWSACGQFLFYVAIDENHRPHKIMRHALGTAQAQDICVYEEADSGFFIGLSETRSGRFLIISAHDHETAEAHLIDAHAPEAAPICVAPRETGIEYEVDDDAARDRLVIVTNWDSQEKDSKKDAKKADDFQIVTAPVPEATGTKADWRVWRAHRAGCLVLDALPFKDHMAVLVRENALPRIILINLGDNQETDIAFDEEAYDLSFGAMAEYDSATMRFTYASMTTPTQTFDFNMASGARILRKTQNVPSGHKADDYITRRITATGHDGAQIPVSLLYHKDTPLDASAPVLLYGYGSYGITIPAAFSVTRLSLVDRGFIYAIAHIRGGRACGHNWFMQGRGAQKTNTFRDFVSAAETLIADGYTKAGQISIHGGSAGGLLVGATVNLAPELFCSAIAEVPFVDVLTTMLDASLPLTPPEWPEWGNPIESAEAYELIAGYAPYENIEAKAYPHILATGGLTDPRVTYWEPAKWIARLRATRQDEGLSLLRTEMSAGHGGKAGRFNQLHEIAFVYAFLLLAHDLAMKEI